MNRWFKTLLCLAPLTAVEACSNSTSGTAPGTSTGDGGVTGDTGAAGDTGVTPPHDAAAPMDVAPVCDPVVVPTFDGGTGDGATTYPDGALLPNVVPRLRSPQVQENFHPNPCEIDEGCATADTTRVLRFDLLTPNEGPGDLYLGPPTLANRPVAGFEYSSCHMHYHLLGYAEYDLLDSCANVVATGHKQSFCLEDTARDPVAMSMHIGQDLPAAQRWGCANQGIHAGWYDLYYRSLQCQFIDVTNVPPGHYRVRARVNTHHVIAETNYDDDVAYLDVDVPPPSDGSGDGGVMSIDPTSACAAGETGPARDCGWALGSTYNCAPGAQVTVGCNQGCMPAVGRCVGTPVMRACAGTASCLHANALADNGHACAMDCPQLQFACPTSGHYTVMFAASDPAHGAIECHVAAQ